MKNCLFVVALLSLALASGCATGGNGDGSGITVTVSDGNLTEIYPTQPAVTFTAAVSGTTNTAVTWSLSGTACTGNPNPCGTINATSGSYQAPATAPSPSLVTITATSQANSTAAGNLTINVSLSAVVTPTTVTVGAGLQQQFTAVAVPDDAPQTFTWSLSGTACAGSPNPCGTINASTGVYQAPATVPSPAQVTITATSSVSQATAGTSKVTVAPSRLVPGPFAFRFSGYESGSPVAVAGSITVAGNGSMTGAEEVLPATGTPQSYSITSGSYAPVSSNNNLGTLTLNLSGGAINQYTAVLTSAGIFRMIESDLTGRTASGVMQRSAPANFNASPSAQTFAFGFTGLDSTANRVGYVGILPMDGNGNIKNGMVDSNDNGTANSYSSVAGTYTMVGGVWTMSLTLGSQTLDFDFYVASGQTANATNPLTLYTISTDPVDATHPALSGSMVYQFPMTSGYNNAAFNGTSVSALTGTNANVSLTLGTTDGTSGGSGGSGGFTGGFDQNDNGMTILSVPSSPGFTYTYVASSGNIGRYIFQLLGNPTASPAVAPLPFVLYASGANRGFLLDQSSAAVMTGTMNPQPTVSGFIYAPSELPGTYAAATVGNSDPGLALTVDNLLLTSPGGVTYNVAGTQNPGSVPLTGSYTLTDTGVGTITLTAPSAATYAIYAIDATTVSNPADSSLPNFAVTDFMMIGTCAPQPCSGTPGSVIFAQQ